MQYFYFFSHFQYSAITKKYQRWYRFENWIQAVEFAKFYNGHTIYSGGKTYAII